MHVRWFGDTPWGGEICTPEYHVDTPVGTKCLECAQPINERDRGVITACSPNIWGSWNLKVEVVDPELGPMEVGYRACSYHLTCFLDQVIGGQWSAKMRSRLSRQQLERFNEDGLPENLPPTRDPGVIYDDEVPQPGRGWGRPVEDDPDPHQST